MLKHFSTTSSIDPPVAARVKWTPHVCDPAEKRSSTVWASSRRVMSSPMRSYKFSMGLRSGEFAGHGRMSNPVGC
ncbi:hypothetical protein TNCV_921751 [Trichonephila clavipes]|nr:hypothetical protein TNCV_921751 [Trichonephila clavipes]